MQTSEIKKYLKKKITPPVYVPEFGILVDNDSYISNVYFFALALKSFSAFIRQQNDGVSEWKISQ